MKHQGKEYTIGPLTDDTVVVIHRDGNGAKVWAETVIWSPPDTQGDAIQRAIEQRSPLTRQDVIARTGATKRHIYNWAKIMAGTDLVSDDGQRFSEDFPTLVAARMGRRGPLPKHFPTPKRIEELFSLWHKYENRASIEGIVIGIADDAGTRRDAGAVWVECQRVGLIK